MKRCRFGFFPFVVRLPSVLKQAMYAHGRDRSDRTSPALAYHALRTAEVNSLKLIEEEAELEAGSVGETVVAGRARLATLFSRKAEWSGLASTKKQHKMRRAIDRRFDGPKHRRTRDFDSDDDFGYGGFGFW